MIKNKKIKQILIILVVIIVILITKNGIVKASIQSNPNTQYTKTDIPTNWMKSFREMETEGETMGLSEVLNEDLTASGESNNIDIHMIKTTEYGATAILSASAYGNPSKVITTTTGNDTGVIIKNNDLEITAGGLQNSFSNTNERYYDIYKYEETSAKVGDALGSGILGCNGWYSTLKSLWLVWNRPIFVRSGNGIFYYANSSNNTSFYCRGVVVCGAGV